MIMPNMDPKKCPMPVQDPDVRNKNFKEVALGYTYEMAVNEAKRCLNCKNKPCVSGCPVNIDIPAFIAKVADEDMEGAYAVLSASSALSSTSKHLYWPSVSKRMRTLFMTRSRLNHCRVLTAVCAFTASSKK